MELLALGGIALTIAIPVISLLVYLRKARPNLIVSGRRRSGGGVNRLSTTEIKFWNRPTLSGFKVHRGTAKIKHVHLYDPEERKVAGTLRWTTETGACTIEAGDHGSLFLFAKDKESGEFFVYDPTRPKNEYTNPTTCYTDRVRDFEIRMRDTLDREYVFNIRVQNEDSGLTIQHKIRLYDRRQMVRIGLGDLSRAFFTPPGTYI